MRNFESVVALAIVVGAMSGVPTAAIATSVPGGCGTLASEACTVEGETCKDQYYECCEGFENQFRGFLNRCECTSGRWLCIAGDPLCLFFGCGEPLGEPTPSPIPTDVCVGDCDDDGRVRIHEIIAGVASALQIATLPCATFDLDSNGTISIAELVTAVRMAMEGCP